MRARRAIAAAAALLALAAAPAFGAFADEEPAKFAKTNERFQHLTGTPAYQAQLREKGLEGQAEALQIATDDPERNPHGNLCVNHSDGCAGDVRLYDWDKAAGNIRRPILWTARSGATISGHVWAVAGGPARKPGVVITNGSVQAPEQGYWTQAAALARAGYVVLTWDPRPRAAPTHPARPRPRTRTPRRSPRGASPTAPRTRSTSSCPRPRRPSGRATPPPTRPGHVRRLRDRLAQRRRRDLPEDPRLGARPPGRQRRLA